MIRKILYSIGGLFALYLVLCLFGKANTKVERSIDIAASDEAIKATLYDFKIFHEKWSPYTKMDPQMKTSYEGNPGEAGYKLSWESDKKEVGKGSLTYNYTNGDTVANTLHFEDYGDSKNYFIVKNNDSTCNVTWGMLSTTPFMFRGMALFMNMDKMIGTDFEDGLKTLKALIESMPKQASYNIEELNWDAKTYYGLKNKLSFDKISAFFGESYGKIGAAMKKAKAEMISAPSAIYFTYDEKTMLTDVAAVMEVAKGKELQGLEKFDLPASKVLKIAYYGAYDKSANAHDAMDDYMKANGLTQTYVLEEYVTDPMTEKDTAKWLTNIYYLVK